MIAMVSSHTIAYAESTTVHLEKPMYLDGEVIIVSGIVSDFKSYPVAIEILDPELNRLHFETKLIYLVALCN